jgi:predicted NUDIX family phosphoesterase
MFERHHQDAYLELAREALSRANRPLTPKQMLEVARGEGFMPTHLSGKTQHRTLAARLAEHIRSKSDSSEFFRTAPATFFLHHLASRRGTLPEHRRVYIGHLRTKTVRKERILVAHRQRLAEEIWGPYVPYDERHFGEIYRNICRFVDRRDAEMDDNLKQFVTFTLVIHDRKLLVYRRGKFTTASERLQGQMSVGFGGHVNDQDFDLFNMGGDAFRANAARELREELFLDEVYTSQREAAQRSSILGYINVDDSPDAEHHIAVLIKFQHKSSDLPKKGELSINQLEWLDLDNPKNDLSDFDLWSGMILRGLYGGKIDVR